MPIPPSSVLYYPWIDIEDERWLRRACLFWDEIKTIVPVSVRRPYRSRSAQHLNDDGILIPVRVDSEMEEIDSLTEAVEDYLTDPASLSLLSGKDAVPARIHPEKLPERVRDLVSLHPDKLPKAVQSHLRGLVDKKGWLQVHPEFANFYMTLLATQLATRLGLGLVTSSNPAEKLATAVRNGVPTVNPQRSGRKFSGRDFSAHEPRRRMPRDTANGMLIDLFMKTIAIPDDVPMKKLLKFRDAHQDELATLRKEMSRLVAEIPEDLSVEALRQSVVNQYKANTRPALTSLQGSLKAQGWSTALTGFLKVSFFTAPPTALLLSSGIATAPVALSIGAIASLAASTISFAIDRRKALTDSPYSYLLSLKRQWG